MYRHFSIAIGDVCLFYEEGVGAVSRVNRISRKEKREEKSDGQPIIAQRQSQNPILRPRSVSSALWPSQMRRYLATGKFAQQRRLMIIKGVWWFRKSWPPQQKQTIKQLLAFQSTFRIYLLYTTLAIAFLVVGVLLAMVMLHPWPVTLLLVLLWIVTTVLTMRLWYACLHMSLAARRAANHTVHATLPLPLKRTVSQLPQAPAKSQPKQPFPPIAKTRPLSLDRSIDQPVPHTRPLFPATPMPPTPLVRVLETIDLSSTNVEHFLETKQQQEPRSQMGDAPVSSIGHTNENVDINMEEETR